MLSNNQKEHIKQLLKDDWLNDNQIVFMTEYLMKFVSFGYETYTNKRREIIWNNDKISMIHSS